MEASDTRRSTRVIAIRSLAVWLVVIAVEIIHGISRAILLVPFVGEFRSNQIGVATGSVLIVLIAYFTTPWIGATRRLELLMVGIIWLGLTVAFELLFGRFVLGLSWQRLAADYNLAHGGLMPLGLVVLALSPMIATKARNLVRRRNRQ